ncbi:MULTISPECIES: homocysteine S-methyltransferase [Acidobacterium]|uniref:S-methylmethionine:homocysteine methyltransferase n=1 Tax=Acidobacterium capsulatum (strain ATCC 51196 / DSM 11244 / BCRC 80197 / JCM 7670 / NBRC 15755 / NCIMB 13165 / 161) TaxID=240015 RepID=C1F5Y3_ACIC5|nr:MULTISPECIES: homocysteine S-methyltransferase [Acidobacterium]ACO33099.1 homocysteine S-methyltransferase [Acidobacterium capsulatum ATCC 51196]HCT60441.1 homocysteine S-methyltransferase [Acidobacterium sp.]
MQPLYHDEFLRIRVLDGGMATELERRGFNISGPLWSAHVLDESPEAIQAVHLDYLRAGSDCISTVSYQISAQGYAELSRPDPAFATALRRSVALAEEARARYAQENSRPIWIAASLGPYGAALHNGAEFHGNYSITFDDLVEFHRARLAVLAETGADLVAFETIPSLDEARAILTALTHTPNVSAWLSFTCRDEAHIAHGEPLAACAQLLDSAVQVLALGINCTAPRHVAPLLAAAQSQTRKPVIAYPNSGESWNAATRAWQGRTDLAAEVKDYQTLAGQWFAAGAQAIGGCCRTTPEHIRAVAAAAVRQ